MKNLQKYSLALYLFICSSCANIVAPSGGNIDKSPPLVKKASPENYSKNFNSKKIILSFNEFINLKDANNQIIVSPEIPGTTFKLRKKNIEINLGSELKENTTYTLNFGDAVSDFTESNINKELRYVFSTSNEIDSLELKGKVVNAYTNSVEKTLPVFLYNELSDSLLYTTKPYYATRTNENGEFKFENIKEGNYFLASIKETNGNKIFDSNDEEISFFTNPIHIHADTIKYELRTFKENSSELKLIDKKFEDKILSLIYNKPSTSLNIEIMSNDTLKKESIIWYSADKDTAKIFLSKYTDSIRIRLYDNLNYSDTLFLKQIKKRTKTIKEFLDIQVTETVDPENYIRISSSRPLYYNDKIDSLILVEDSTKLNIKDLLMKKDTFTYVVNYTLSDEKIYQIQLKDSTFFDNSLTYTKANKYPVVKRKIDTYGNIQIKINTNTDTYLIQLLDSKNLVLKTDIINGNAILNYKNYNPGEYKLRIIHDLNTNGKWDTGNFLKRVQPEKVFYYPGSISLRANWDLELEYTFE